MTVTNTFPVKGALACFFGSVKGGICRSDRCLLLCLHRVTVDAGKIGDHDTTGRAALGTLIALDALIVVDAGEIVNDGDRTGRTVLLTLTATDTAV